MSFFPHLRRSVAPEYAVALAEVRTVLSRMSTRMANCSRDRLPGQAVASLCELQRATDHVEFATHPPNGRTHTQLVCALLELQEDVAELARSGGESDSILRSQSLAFAERAVARLQG